VALPNGTAQRSGPFYNKNLQDGQIGFAESIEPWQMSTFKKGG
jgi:hypothetical protein